MLDHCWMTSQGGYTRIHVHLFLHKGARHGQMMRCTVNDHEPKKGDIPPDATQEVLRVSGSVVYFGPRPIGMSGSPYGFPKANQG